MQTQRTLVTMSISLMIAGLLTMTLFIVGCGEDEQPIAAPSQQTFMAPEGGEEIPPNPNPEELGPPPAATVALEPAAKSFGILAATAIVEEATLKPEKITATLKPGECIEEHKEAYIPGAPPKGDVIFAIDLTGSMGGEHNNVKVNSINIMNAIRGVIPDTNFGVISHMDYNGFFSGCGYSSSYGGGPDYPYSLDQALTSNTTTVAGAINALSLGWGNDGPENYTRILYESYSDASIGWRSGAKRILLYWQDNVPHDCNYRLDCGGLGTTGPDPGRDATVGTADDLDLATALQGMADNNITLIGLHSGGWLSLWDCYADKTGGDAFPINSDGTVPGGTDIATFVADLIEEEVSHIDTLTLKVCTEGYEDWLVSVVPDAYYGIDLEEPMTFEFDIEICVPEGTEAGEYCFEVCVDGDGVVYATQEVCITVITCVEGAEVRITPETFNVQQSGKWVTGHVTTLPPGYTNADIIGGEIVSIGGIDTSILGEKKGDGVLKFSAAEFADVAGLIVGPGDARAEDVPVCVVVYFSDGMESCEYCDLIDIINEGGKKK